jgi:hypothetical protein
MRRRTLGSLIGATRFGCSFVHPDYLSSEREFVHILDVLCGIG